MEVSAVTGGELACRARSEGVCGRSVIEWLLPSPARARRACPLPGQGEGSGNGNLRRKQKIHRLVECTHETLGLTEMPNLSIRDLESLNDSVIVAARARIGRIGLCSGASTTVKPFARRQGYG